MRLTAQQILKDFHAAGVELTLVADVAKSFELLHAALLPQVNRLMQQQFEVLLSALYRIDVPEQAVAQASASGEPLQEAITTLIIHRELKKILVRMWMSGSPLERS